MTGKECAAADPGTVFKKALSIRYHARALGVGDIYKVDPIQGRPERPFQRLV
jgi:hypothetical protein